MEHNGHYQLAMPYLPTLVIKGPGTLNGVQILHFFKENKALVHTLKMQISFADTANGPAHSTPISFSGVYILQKYDFITLVPKKKVPNAEK